MMIREATQEDAKSIEELYRILLPDHPDVQVSPARIEQIAASADSFLFVLEKAGQIVSTVHLHFCLDALSADRPFAVIERVVTVPEERGKGYGEALMRHAEEAAAARGALKVMLSSAAGRQGAHRFYEGLGYDGDSSRLFKKYIRNQQEK